MADRRKKLSTVVAEGDRQRSLEALRDVLASSIEEAEPENRASLAKQLRDVIAELATLEKPEGSTKDELRKKRDDRRRAAAAGGAEDTKVRAPAGGSGGQRRSRSRGSGGERGAPSGPVAGRRARGGAGGAG